MLGVLFALAVLGVVGFLYALGLGLSLFSGVEGIGSNRYSQVAGVPSMRWWESTIAWGVAAVGLVIITLGTLYKSYQLRAGGMVIAHSLGARPLDPLSADMLEQRLLNVVEEMAIASGVPRPDIYILEDEGINAFAAGITTSDTVVGVTKGCMERLSRDELQNVIAHEFSHILNGDMRVNMHAVGLLHGVFVVALLGRLLMRVGGRNREGASFALAGVALLVIGSVGVFFGRMIQSAISRQRELLADASAVQFTRHPSGLAAALKKIGGAATHGFVSAPSADESSHMFFSEAIKRFKPFASMFRTHPPLAVRITKLEPGWDGQFILAQSATAATPSQGGTQTPMPPAMSQLTPADVSAGISNIGDPTAHEMAYAAVVHDAMPKAFRQALHDSQKAQSLIYGLLLGGNAEHLAQATEVLKARVEAEAITLALHFRKEFTKLPSVEKIAAIDLALPALRAMSETEYEHFVGVVSELTRTDGRVDVFEFALGHIIRRHLGLSFRKGPRADIQFRSFKMLAPDSTVILSVLAKFGDSVRSEQERAFEAGARALGLSGAQFDPSTSVSVFERALKRFDHAAPQIKKNLMYACSMVVCADGQVVDHEAELIRAIGDAMGVPVPPFVGEI